MTEAALALEPSVDLFDKAGNLEVITFSIDKAQYAIPISQVRYIEQDNRKTTRVDSANGVVEVVQYQGETVPICEFSEMVNVESEYKQNVVLAELLKARELDHIGWMDALEVSLRNGVEFTKAKDPHICAFGGWYDTFEANDEVLAEIMVRFDEPHKQIHGLADVLLGMLAEGDKEGALERFDNAKKITLGRLLTLFQQATDRVQSLIRPVLVFVARKGGKPLAVRLNAINEIVTCHEKQFAPYDSNMTNLGKELEVIVGYLQSEGAEAPTILLDWRLHD